MNTFFLGIIQNKQLQYGKVLHELTANAHQCNHEYLVNWFSTIPTKCATIMKSIFKLPAKHATYDKNLCHFYSLVLTA